MLTVFDIFSLANRQQLTKRALSEIIAGSVFNIDQ